VNSDVRFEQRLSLVTLGVTDLGRSTRFYTDVMGWTSSSIGGDEVTFFQLNGLVLGLFPHTALAEDAGVPSLENGGLARVALAHNVRERHEVDALLSRVERAGARVLKPAADAPWGGRSGYFADPDGFLWEVAWNPSFAIGDDGSIRMPE